MQNLVIKMKEYTDRIRIHTENVRARHEGLAVQGRARSYRERMDSGTRIDPDAFDVSSSLLENTPLDAGREFSRQVLTVELPKLERKYFSQPGMVVQKMVNAYRKAQKVMACQSIEEARRILMEEEE